MTFPHEQIVAAHAASSKHRAQIERSTLCGCFYCLAIFPPAEIATWLNESDGTALCPHCGIDSVIGDASNWPIREDFLAAMHDHWFQR